MAINQIDNTDKASFIFTDKTILRLLRFLLVNENSFSASELGKATLLKSADVNKALKLLVASGLVKCTSRKKGKAYRLDSESNLLQPLRQLLRFDFKSNSKELKKIFKQVGSVEKIIFTGNLTDNHRGEVDVVVVGNIIDENKLAKILQKIGFKAGYELRYICLTPAEFQYRNEMNDRLLRNILDFDHHFIHGSL